jgi:hypothetical protein
MAHGRNLRRLSGALCRWLLLSAVILAQTAASARQASAASELLAVTGSLQPGSTSVQLLGVSAATLNEGGEVAFRATLKQGVGLINAANDRAVWRIDGADRRLLAQAGVGGVPGGGSFDAFQAVSIGDAGEVVIRATTASARTGIWRYPSLPGAGSSVATTGVIGVPGLPTAQFDAIGFQLLHAPGNVVAYRGELAVGVGGVTSENNFGVWSDIAASPSLLVREQATPSPGVDGGQFLVPSAVAVNNQVQIALFGTLIDGIAGVSSPNSLGIWRMSAGGGELVARRHSGGVADVADASFSALTEPTINDAGQIAFAAELAIEGAVTSVNNRGVWLHDGASGELLVRSAGPAPGTAGATFAGFETPLLNNAGQALVAAALVEGAGGVNSQNSHGLWVIEPDGGTLIARTGSAGVPGVPGANFASFGSLAFNESGVAAVQASLANVAPGTDQGLWLLDGSASSVLVARTGDVVGSRTIASLEFTGGSGGGDGRQRALNSSGQLVYKATFTNGDEGLFLYSPTIASSADFTLDGNVNGADLLRWKNGFGQTAGAGRAQGDADSDGDVDGGDFLLWQRQLGVGVPLAPIPEPSLAALLLPVAVVCGLRFSRGARKGIL